MGPDLSPSTGLEGLRAWPGTRRSAGWVALDGSSQTAGQADGAFRLASVTKVLTAMGVLVGVQEGIVELDEAAGPPGSTVRLLLCHASGLPFDGPVPIAHPGERRIYGNAAYEVLGRLLAERAGMTSSEYVHEGVCAPLAMASTDLGASPAHGARSTVEDLLRLARELLAPGQVLAPELLAEATTPQLPGLRGVLPGFGKQDPNPWGLGFEIHGSKSPHWMPATASPRAFGHFGRSGSFLWVDPDAGVACAALSETPFGPWATEVWPALGAAVLARSAV